MRKLSILTLAFAATVLILLTVCMNGNAQSEAKVRKMIAENNIQFKRWFNTGQVDSLLTLYRDDACIVGQGCGKTYIREFYMYQMSIFKFEDMQAISISVGDSIAVEKGRWMGRLDSGPALRGEYLTEWRRVDKKTWKIVNDISASE